MARRRTVRALMVHQIMLVLQQHFVIKAWRGMPVL